MKIAILGTAPQFLDAPFHTDWKIWAVPGCYGVENDKGPRNKGIHRIYEFHDDATMAITCEPREGFIDFALSLGPDFIMREKRDRYPNATVFDWKRHVDKHGRAPFSCSVSWMMAEAIETLLESGEEEKEIGIWGVNMAHDSEYVYQKPGVRDMIGYARGVGIKVFVPETSELMAIHSLYGVEDLPPAFKIIKGRTKDMQEKKAHYEKQEQTAVQSINFFNGALSELDYLKDNFNRVDDRRKEIVATIEHHKAEREEALRMCNIFHGALEEHSWVEQNFFKYAG